MGLFAQVNTMEIDVGDGFVVTMRKEMDAGVQEDLDAHYTKVKQDFEGNQEYILHNSKLTLVRLMIMHVRKPDGGVIPGPISEADARKFDRAAYAKLVNAVESNNRPFAVVRTMARLEEEGIDIGQMDQDMLMEVLAGELEQGMATEATDPMEDEAV